jgi:hypothetical protein
MARASFGKSPKIKAFWKMNRFFRADECRVLVIFPNFQEQAFA